MADKDSLVVEEQALFEQEHGLVEMEAQLYEQEQGVAQMERAFKKRNKTLLNLVSYVADQERSLLSRAEAIGPRAKSLVDDILQSSSATEGATRLEIGKESARRELLQRREALLQERMRLVEERESVYAARYEAIELAEAAIADLERGLLQREREISEALRELISSSSTLLSEDEGDEDDEEPASRGRREGPPDRVREPAAREPAQATREAGETGEVGLAPRERGDESVTRRRKGRARARTNQFRITLEAQLEGGESELFVYENDGPEELPGVFIATPNLLKVGREVRVRVGLRGTQLEATGVVAWRRQRGEPGGPPGMGVELLQLGEADRAIVTDWLARHPPQVI